MSMAYFSTRTGSAFSKLMIGLNLRGGILFIVTSISGVQIDSVRTIPDIAGLK